VPLEQKERPITKEEEPKRARKQKSVSDNIKSKFHRDKEMKQAKIVHEVLKQTKANIIVGQFLELAPYCKQQVMEAFLSISLPPKRPIEVCHVKTQDFNIEMLVITARIKHYTIYNVLLDRGSRVNIITEELCQKLGYRKLKLTPFTIKMADQRKVTPLGII